MRNSLAALVALALGAVLASTGCGENSRACGENTKEVDGYCVANDLCGFGTRFNDQTHECVPDGTVVCSDGTVFDDLTGECKIDESSCQNGTVLIDDACADPATGLVIDVQEGPEPNGLGVIEESLAQAGNIVLKPSEPFVVHGTIDPWRDLDGDGSLDPDVDTYVLTTGSPAFVRITADGINGMAGGFVALAAVDAEAPLATWKRVGTSLVSDTADREVFLPAAGTYRIAIADTRTLVDYVTTGTSHTAPGGDTSEYYVSLTPFMPPAPTTLTLVNGRVTTMGTKSTEKLAFYTAAFGNGLNAADLSVSSSLADEALVVTNNSVLVTAVADPSGSSRALFGGLDPGDEPIVIVDHVYSLVPTDVSFTLTLVANTAKPLSTTGTAVTATASTNTGTDFTRLNQWSFETTTDDATVGMFITFSPAIVGQIYDEAGVRAAAFTSPSTSATWTTYRGLLRLPKPGRYYIAGYVPGSTATTTITATSTIAELPATPVVESTPVTAAVSATYRALPFTYDAGTTDPWQQFNVTGVNTGGQTASWFDPAIAYGRLDPLTASSGTLAPEVTPIFAKTFPVGGGVFGRVLISDPTLSYYVKVNATAPAASPAVTLSFQPRAAVFDFGAVASGTTATHNGDTLTTAQSTRYYLLRAPVGKSVTITVTPGVGTMNTTFRRLNADESTLGAVVNNGAAGAADSVTFTQTGTDWTGLAVTASTAVTASPAFTVSVQVQ